MQLLTLSEMAAKYKRTPKTFSRYVKLYSIPYEPLGRSMMFDPVAVSNHLAAVRASEPVAKRSVRYSRKKVVGSRFAEAVGI